jgi:hypothetical protein
MPTTPDSPAKQLASELRAVLEGEFNGEGITVYDDKLLVASGENAAQIGIYPEGEEEYPGNANALLVTVNVQVYNSWSSEWANDPDQHVDPSTIADWADRFRRAVKTHNATRGRVDNLWYFRVTRIQYGDDPTGNRTRFEATVIGVADNDGEV